MRPALQTDGAHFILNHFDTFFSIIVHSSKVELDIHLRSFNRIHKGNILRKEFSNYNDIMTKNIII